MDYVDFIAHVFSTEERTFYGLVRLLKSATSLIIADVNAEIKATIAATRAEEAGHEEGICCEEAIGRQSESCFAENGNGEEVNRNKIGSQDDCDNKVDPQQRVCSVLRLFACGSIVVDVTLALNDEWHLSMAALRTRSTQMLRGDRLTETGHPRIRRPVPALKLSECNANKQLQHTA